MWADLQDLVAHNKIYTKAKKLYLELHRKWKGLLGAVVMLQTAKPPQSNRVASRLLLSPPYLR